MPLPAPTRVHLTRLMHIWRSAGWPCRDPIELDVVAAGWATPDVDAGGRETLRLTDEGLRLLADSRQRNRRALSTHDRLGERVARQLMDGGRIVWREVSLRARLPELAGNGPGQSEGLTPSPSLPLPLPLRPALPLLALEPEPAPAPTPAPAAWRLARPDVFSVRNTSVEAYLHPAVHEIKTSRADLLSDLRNEAKRRAYQGLCCECYYVFPAGLATLDEVPPELGVWLLHGDVDTGALELARPARHVPCTLPFGTWLALAKAAPLRGDDAPPPAHANATDDGLPAQDQLGAPPR